MAVDPTSDSSKSAKDLIFSKLDQYGLGSLATWAWNKYLAGESPDQIMLELRDTAEYKARFPGMAELRKQNLGWNEDQWINYENNAVQLMHNYGLPQGFLDSHADVAKLIMGRTSLQEFEQRLQVAQQTAATSPHGQQLRDELSRIYGVPNAAGLAVAYELNPDVAEPVIMRQVAAAKAGVASQDAGFGQLSQQQAEQVGDIGISDDQAKQTFGRLAQMSELTDTTFAGEDALTKQDLIDASFTGNAQAAQRVQRKAAQRTATFQQGGGYAATQAGLTGLGSANK